MGKITIIAAIALLFLVASVMAQTLPKPKIKEIGLLGKGLAISESDPKDVHGVRIGIATVTVNLTGQESDLSAGILYFDNTRYIIKDIVVGNNTASGNVYINGTEVGSVQVSLTSKPKVDLWMGTLTLNSNTYNLYILEGKSTIKPDELGDKVSNYCTAHHEDKNCSDKINEYCQNNPQDARCLALFRNFCRTHLEDERCREGLKGWCKNNTNSELCKDYCQNNPMVCGLQVKKCENCPDGYRPTADGFCAPNCGKVGKFCPHNIIKCPSTTTTTQITTTTTVAPTTILTTTTIIESTTTVATTTIAPTTTTTGG